MTRKILIVFLLAASASAFAQEPPVERLQKLEQRLDELQKENDALRAEIEALKSELGVSAATQPAAEEDLTKIDVAETPAPATLQNQPAPAAAKVLNPDISVIGNFVAKVGDPNEFEERPSAAFDEAEIAFQAFVDPYAQAKFFLAVTPDEVELEEGFINFIALPKDFTARVGKLKASFGKANLMHTHVRKTVDQPLVIKNFFGEEGLSDAGISVSRLFPNRYNVFVEGTAEVFSGNVDDVFAAQNLNDLFYLGHLKAYRDIDERNNVEVGTSYARGTSAASGDASEFYGVDLSYRYKPLERSIYRSFIARTELIANRDDAFGFYASADYQLARRWFAGLRFDQADRLNEPDVTDRGTSLTLTFWPSEFSQIRGQARRMRYGNGPSVNELLLQLQFSIGAHGAHTF